MKVVSLTGAPVGDSREPVPACVECVEDVLDRARSGEIVGLATVILNHDGVVGWHMAGRVGGYGMVGAAELIKTLLLETARDDN